MGEVLVIVPGVGKYCRVEAGLMQISYTLKRRVRLKSIKDPSALSMQSREV